MSHPVFKISRQFKAPRELVWRAWTVPALFGQWFGPAGFTSEVKTHELRVGGVLHTCIKSAEGHEMWGKFVYREVEPPSRLVWEHSFSDSEGNLTRHPMSAAWPLKLLTTVELNEIDGGTELILTWTPLDANEAECTIFGESMASMEQGWGGTFGQLTQFLAQEQ